MKLLLPAFVIFLSLLGCKTVADDSTVKAAQDSGTYYSCKDSDRPDIAFLIDFSNKTVDTISVVRREALAHENMLSADADFQYVGESLRQQRTGALEDNGKVILERTPAGVITGSYKGNLTFGDKWTFASCREMHD